MTSAEPMGNVMGESIQKIRRESPAVSAVSYSYDRHFFLMRNTVTSGSVMIAYSGEEDGLRVTVRSQPDPVATWKPVPGDPWSGLIQTLSKEMP